ncbi:TetR/AcrR family transcriptional regulator [Paenibacillaceae bacterium]|nr:TetR/AcrR family transcriptional regulator [Paenibacillaceae bacterium]
MNKKQAQSEQTKKKIADAARALFALKGYTATSIEDIVGAVGSSKGNIYYHFKSKEGLFLYLLDQWEQEWNEQWHRQEGIYTTVEEKLSGLAEHSVLHDLNHPLTNAATEFMNESWDNSNVQMSVAQYFSEHLAFNQQMLQQGMDAGELRRDDTLLMGAVFEALLIGLGEVSRRSPNMHMMDLYKKAMHIFLHGTAANGPGAANER